MSKAEFSVPSITIGLDIGDRTTRVCELDAQGRCVDARSIGTSVSALVRHFTGRSRARVILEAGTHSPWVSRTLSELGHEVVVANPSALYGRRRRKKRNDAMDAEYLCCGRGISWCASGRS